METGRLPHLPSLPYVGGINLPVDPAHGCSSLFLDLPMRKNSSKQTRIGADRGIFPIAPNLSEPPEPLVAGDRTGSNTRAPSFVFSSRERGRGARS